MRETFDIAMLHLPSSTSRRTSGAEQSLGLFAEAVNALKPMLLYGDNITYYGTSVDVLRAIPETSDYETTSVNMKIELLDGILPIVLRYPEMRDLAGISQAAVEQLASNTELFSGALVNEIQYEGFSADNETARALWDKIWLASLDNLGNEIWELDRLVTSRRVELVTLEEGALGVPETIKLDPAGLSPESYELAHDLLRVTVRILSDRSRQPALSELVQKMFQLPEELSGARSSGATGIRLAREWFGYLPGFQRASVGEILEIRSDLEPEIRGFRQAVCLLEEEIDPESSPSEFSNEARRLWRTVGNPALKEIDDAVHRNRYLRQLSDRYFSKADGMLAGGSIAIGASSGSALVTAVTAAASAAFPSLRATWDHIRERDDVRRNRLYFLYAAERALDHRK